ncbi:hypothetical protein GCM10010217_28240 [Streptomyces tubercidicus]
MGNQVMAYRELSAWLAGPTDYWDRPDGDWPSGRSQGSADEPVPRERQRANTAYVMGSRALRRGDLARAWEWFALAGGQEHPGSAFRLAVWVLRRADAAEEEAGGDRVWTREVAQVLGVLVRAAQWGHGDARQLLDGVLLGSVEGSLRGTVELLCPSAEAAASVLDTVVLAAQEDYEPQDGEFFPELIARLARLRTHLRPKAPKFQPPRQRRGDAAESSAACRPSEEMFDSAVKNVAVMLWSLRVSRAQSDAWGSVLWPLSSPRGERLETLRRSELLLDLYVSRRGWGRQVGRRIPDVRREENRGTYRMDTGMRLAAESTVPDSLVMCLPDLWSTQRNSPPGTASGSARLPFSASAGTPGKRTIMSEPGKLFDFVRVLSAEAVQEWRQEAQATVLERQPSSGIPRRCRCPKCRRKAAYPREESRAVQAGRRCMGAQQPAVFDAFTLAGATGLEALNYPSAALRESGFPERETVVQIVSRCGGGWLLCGRVEEVRAVLAGFRQTMPGSRWLPPTQVLESAHLLGPAVSSDRSGGPRPTSLELMISSSQFATGCDSCLPSPVGPGELDWSRRRLPAAADDVILHAACPQSSGVDVPWAWPPALVAHLAEWCEQVRRSQGNPAASRSPDEVCEEG